MKRLSNPDFWSNAGERAIKTMAQSALATLGTASVGLIEANWYGVISAAVMGGLLSILTSIASK